MLERPAEGALKAGTKGDTYVQYVRDHRQRIEAEVGNPLKVAGVTGDPFGVKPAFMHLQAAVTGSQ